MPDVQQQDAMGTDQSLVIARTFPAPRALVFQAWSSAAISSGGSARRG